MATEKKSLVEEALLQMKNLENVVTENAKGILASTMKEEIEELVKESLEEETNEMMDDEKPEMEEGVHMDTEVQEEDDSLEIDMSDDDMELPMGDMSMDDEMEDDMMGDDDELSPLDMTQASDDELLKIVMGMGDEDRLIIQKDGDTANADMLSQTDSMSFEMGDEDDSDMDDNSMEFEDDEEEIVYEIEMEEDEDGSDDDNENMNESMTVKPKGVGMGSGPKKVGFKGENIHKGPKGKSAPEAKKFVKGEMKEGDDEEGKDWGKKKHEYKREKVDGVEKKAGEKDGHYKDYEETKEAARTYGNGSRNYPGRGLPKMKVITNSALKEEVETLRAKNDEYRKALNIFREKLNEVAVFNSNLAYATRLFTEHSTTKQEKINIMRRFDNVETIKESKNLYTQIKGELDTKQTSVVKESIVENIDRTPTKGSSNLVENKTYENPQFLRMKDLMSKLTK